MENKRGQFFALYLVVLTLFLCGVVIFLYSIQQDNVSSSFVSPSTVLETRDDLEIFEMREIGLIESSLESSKGDFSDDVFLDSFRKSFINGIMSDENMKNFIFRDLVIYGTKVREIDKNRNLIENAIYPRGKSEFVDDDFVFVRSKIEKRMLLSTKEDSDIKFPIEFEFEFEERYLISKVDNKFVVRKE